MRSSASGEAVGNSSPSDLCRSGGSESSIVAAKGERMDAVSSGEGRPVTSSTRSSWFMVELPGKSGLPTIISARMQPA